MKVDSDPVVPLCGRFSPQLQLIDKVVAPSLMSCGLDFLGPNPQGHGPIIGCISCVHIDRDMCATHWSLATSCPHHNQPPQPPPPPQPPHPSGGRPPCRGGGAE